MIILYCVLGLIALIVLILCIPVGFTVEHTEETYVKLRILGIPFTVVSPDTAKRQDADKKPPSESGGKPQTKEEGKTKKIWQEVHQFLKNDQPKEGVAWLTELVEIVRYAATKLRRAVTIRRLLVRREVVGDDAAATALAYGKTCAVVYPLFAAIGELFRIRKQGVEVVPCFIGESGKTMILINGNVSPIRVIGAVICIIVKLKLDQLGAK